MKETGNSNITRDAKAVNAASQHRGWSYPYLIGLATAFGMLGFYVGLLTLISDWDNASMQFERYRW